METYTHQMFEEERALYGKNGVRLKNCSFEGPADGESALKVCTDVQAEDCRFLLRYPLWHVTGAVLDRCEMTETCRAAMWYDDDLTLRRCSLGGIKALRECRNVRMEDCQVVSPEFGWSCRGVEATDCKVTGEYLFLHAADLQLDRFELHGKYSFQYVENAVIRNADLNTKDAFWHSRNVTVCDSTVAGEYLGWYSENLHLIRCHITGTQPLCYCKGLILEDCTMEGCDLAFENSEVEATVIGGVDSIRRPASGTVTLDSVGAVLEDTVPIGQGSYTIRIR